MTRTNAVAKRGLSSARDALQGRIHPTSLLTKGNYRSSTTGKTIEILDLDVRMALENGISRNGLVLYRYAASTQLRVAHKLWFAALLPSGLPRFQPVDQSTTTTEEEE